MGTSSVSTAQVFFWGGVQEGVDAQLADKMSVRLSGQFVSPRLSNRLSHPKPAPPPRGAPWIALPCG